MDELTIIIDDFGHKGLEEYLMSLTGIKDVKIKNDEQLEIYLNYDSKLITPKIIKMEVLLFLNIVKIPSMISFNKHPKIETLNYTIIRNDLCCEYCFKGAIENLFEIEGIEKVESNFEEENYYSRDNIVINVFFNPKILSIEDMKQIELKLNI